MKARTLSTIGLLVFGGCGWAMDGHSFGLTFFFVLAVYAFAFLVGAKTERESR